MVFRMLAGKKNVLAPPAFEGGSVLADVTVPVASRIPLDALDEARIKGAGLRLKMRVHPGGRADWLGH